MHQSLYPALVMVTRNICSNRAWTAFTWAARQLSFRIEIRKLLECIVPSQRAIRRVIGPRDTNAILDNRHRPTAHMFSLGYFKQVFSFLGMHSRWSTLESALSPRLIHSPSVQSSRNLAFGPLHRLDCQGEQYLQDKAEDIALIHGRQE